MPEETISPEVFRAISWNDAFAEGEKRIKQKLLDALVKTPARDRVRLMAQREAIQKKISRALEENDSRKLKSAFKAQVKLLAIIQRNA